eukprot:4399844-Prymnesium_polylepis.1
MHDLELYLRILGHAFETTAATPGRAGRSPVGGSAPQVKRAHHRAEVRTADCGASRGAKLMRLT